MTAFSLLNQERSGNCTAILLSFFIKTIKLWLIIGMDDCPKIHTNSRVDKKNRMSHIYGKLITAAADKEKLSVLQVSARCECLWFFFILLNVTKYIPIDCFFCHRSINCTRIRFVAAVEHHKPVLLRSCECLIHTA